MPLPSFATLERRLAAVNVGAFCNRVLVKGGVRFNAVLDRDLNPVGDFDLTAHRQDRLTLDLANAPALAIGDTVSMDPDWYTAPELAAESKTSWKLERKDSDDGTVAVWWLK
jgi:hypothetical protein